MYMFKQGDVSSLHLASWMDAHDIVLLLFKYGADPALRDQVLSRHN